MLVNPVFYRFRKKNFCSNVFLRWAIRAVFCSVRVVKTQYMFLCYTERAWICVLFYHVRWLLFSSFFPRGSGVASGGGKKFRRARERIFFQFSLLNRCKKVKCCYRLFRLIFKKKIWPQVCSVWHRLHALNYIEFAFSSVEEFRNRKKSTHFSKPLKRNKFLSTSADINVSSEKQLYWHL